MERIISIHPIKEEVENNFCSTNCDRERGYYNQERTNYSCFHCRNFRHKAVDCRYKHQTNVAENSYQNTDESYESALLAKIKPCGFS